jgi:N-acetylglutamate synthase-like GNAT family acetyltransferase
MLYLSTSLKGREFAKKHALTSEPQSAFLLARSSRPIMMYVASPALRRETLSMTQITIRDATGEGDLDQVRRLFREYAASLAYGICFETFAKELEGLPGRYAPPNGLLLLAAVAKEPGGCVAMRPLQASIGEMKRLYVRPVQRRFGLGRRLVEELLRRAGANRL